MTREEIKQLKGAEPNCFETSREEEWYCEGLVQGLEITEKELIDKACEWLLYQDFDGQCFRDCDESFNNDLLVSYFRKAMEE